MIEIIAWQLKMLSYMKGHLKLYLWIFATKLVKWNFASCLIIFLVSTVGEQKFQKGIAFLCLHEIDTILS